MRRIVFLVAAIMAAGCVDEEATRPQPGLDPVTAHNPQQYSLRNAVTPQQLPSYTGVQNAAASATPSGSATLEINADGDVPRFADAYIGSVAVFGYAWADLDTGAGLVAVIHPLIGRDSHQSPDGWHTHPVQLAGGTGTSHFCIVSIGTSQAGMVLRGSQLRVNAAAKQLGVAAGALDVAASFIVEGNAGCSVTGLGVVVLNAVAL